MSSDLGRLLIAAGVALPDEIEAALAFSVLRGVPFVRALIDQGAVSEHVLEYELSKRGGLLLRHVAPAPELIARLPVGMCRRLGAVPTGVDPYTGVIDVAVADSLDPHIGQEFGFHLRAQIRFVRAPMAAIEAAIRHSDPVGEWPTVAAPHPPGRTTQTFPHGAPTTNPPPPPSDVPIPLVRRSGGPTAPIDDAETTDAQTKRPGPATYPPPELEEPVLPLRRSKVPATAPPVNSTTLPPTVQLTDRALPMHSPVDSHLPTLRRQGRDDGGRTVGPDDDTVIESRGRDGGADDAAPMPLTTRSLNASPLSPDAAVSRPLNPEAPFAGAAKTTKTLPSAFEAAYESTTPSPRSGSGGLDAHVRDSLRRAASRDDVVKHALYALRLCARRVAVFVVKRDGFHGWVCSPEFAHTTALRGVVVPHDQPSIFAAATSMNSFRGEVANTAAHAPLLAVTGAVSDHVVAVVARAGGRPAMVLVADELAGAATTVRLLEEIASAVGDALSRILAARHVDS